MNLSGIPGACTKIDLAARNDMNEGLLNFEDYSRQSLKRRFYKMDTSLRQTPGVGPCRFPVILLLN